MVKGRRFTLPEIGELTGIPQRLLRYAFDEPLPGQKGVLSAHVSTHGRGRAREFSPFSAFMLAVTAAMLDVGFGRPAVDALVTAALDQAVPRWKSKTAIQQFVIFRWAKRFDVEVRGGLGEPLLLRVTAQDDEGHIIGQADWFTIATNEGVEATRGTFARMKFDWAKILRVLS